MSEENKVDSGEPATDNREWFPPGYVAIVKKADLKWCWHPVPAECLGIDVPVVPE